jgi:Mg2+ and Co2+ transporter CorA
MVQAQDPFYLLYPLFQQVAFAESQMLDLVDAKIKKHEVGVISSNSIGTIDNETSHSQLLHFQGFLEYRIENLHDTLNLIRKHGGGSWRPQSDDGFTKIIDATMNLLRQDFEYLLDRAHSLLKKIERSISLRMSLVNIDQARRSTEQNTAIFRFTIVASIYIPLSFTTSFFGMNFRELGQEGQGSLSIWVFFVFTIPVFILSVLGLFVRRSWIEQFQGFLSRRIISWAAGH